MTYVMSDIHGNVKAFENVLKQINFGKDDKLYILGDVIDRNPGGIKLLQRIMNDDRMRMLIGNHELMLMQAHGLYPNDNDKAGATRQWYQNGGKITNRELMKLLKPERQKIFDFIDSLSTEFVLDVNGKRFILVHATFSQFASFFNMKGFEIKEFAVWDRESILMVPEIDALKDITFIFGHTPTINLQDKSQMEIYQNRNIIGIDCGAAYKDIGRLACIRLEDMKVFYSET